MLEREWLWHASGQALANGAALGVFFGLLIPVGQLPLAAAGAILLRGNLPAAALGTLVSNPFTVGPIYWLAYQTGRAILAVAGVGQALPSAAAGADNPMSAFASGWFEQLANLGKPLMLGLAVLALGGAVLTYIAVRLAWRRRPRHRPPSA